MKRVFIFLLFLLVGFISYTQTNNSTGASTTQNSSGTIAWSIEAVTASQSADDDESILAGLAGLVRTSNKLLVEDFSLAAFTSGDDIESAAIEIDFQQNLGVALDLDFRVDVIRINSLTVESTLLSFTGTQALGVLGIITVSIDETSGWMLTGLTGNDINTSTFRIEIEADIPAGVAFDFGVDRVQLQFSTEAPLPVEWGAISVNESENGAHINWSTEVESGNAYFLVEKSQDAKEWKAFEKVEAVGNSYEKTLYAAVDQSPFTPRSYYRIKQVDFDGSYDYSKMISLQVKQKARDKPIVVNPIVDRLIVKNLPTDIEGNLDLKVIDSSGRVLLQRTVDGGTGSFEIDNTVAPGNHYLLISSEQMKQNWTIPVVSLR